MLVYNCQQTKDGKINVGKTTNKTSSEMQYWIL